MPAESSQRSRHGGGAPPRRSDLPHRRTRLFHCCERSSIWRPQPSIHLTLACRCPWSHVSNRRLQNPHWPATFLVGQNKFHRLDHFGYCTYQNKLDIQSPDRPTKLTLYRFMYTDTYPTAGNSFARLYPACTFCARHPDHLSSWTTLIP